MSLLNIFANFFIDTPERYQRMKDSFLSFRDVSADKWAINVRGRFADESISFLTGELGNKIFPFRLNSMEGWFHDTRNMLSAMDGDHVLFWLEDHINMAPVELLDSIVAEMKDKGLEYMIYSFWQSGLLRSRYDGIKLKRGNFVDYFEHTPDNNCIVQKNIGGSYIISAVSIMSSELFSRIIGADDPVPRRWPKETPFDFEKAPTDTHWLPLKVAVPREELFASIDDDLGVPGSCLQSRGLYPLRIQRQSYAAENSGNGWLTSCFLHSKKMFATCLRKRR